MIKNQLTYFTLTVTAMNKKQKKVRQSYQGSQTDLDQIPGPIFNPLSGDSNLLSY